MFRDSAAEMGASPHASRTRTSVQGKRVHETRIGAVSLGGGQFDEQAGHAVVGGGVPCRQAESGGLEKPRQPAVLAVNSLQVDE